MKYLAAICLLLVLIPSCDPYKRVIADKKVTEKEKDMIRPWFQYYFPTEEKYIKGEAINTTDTTIDVDAIIALSSALDSLQALKPECRINIDSILKKYCIPKIINNGKTRVDTFRTTDTDQVDKLNRDIAAYKERISALEEKQTIYLAENKTLKTGQRKWLWWLIALGVVNVGVIVYKIIKTIKSPVA